MSYKTIGTQQVTHDIEITICDECEKEIKTNRGNFYIAVEQKDSWEYDRMFFKDFCSWKCLKEFAEKHSHVNSCI